MTSWTDFATAEPEMAAQARAMLSAATNAVLGTIRRDGSPRLSGIDPFFFEDDLWIGSMPHARKGADLRRDPRMALHGVPWESRRLRTGATDPGDGDVKLNGRARLIDDAGTQDRIMTWFATETGQAPPGPADLFAVDLADVVTTSVADDQLVIDHWSSTEGRTTVRRS